MASKRLRHDSLSDPTEKDDQTEAPEPNTPADRAAKFVQLEASASESPTAAITCALPPHPLRRFSSIASYERHIASAHSNRCRECARNFPTPRFLELHIAENHDPFFAAKRERIEQRGDDDDTELPFDPKLYACFLEDCDKRCRDWRKRRNHLVDKHGFPRNYDFFIVNTGIDGRTSMLRPGVDAQGHRARSREGRRPSKSAASDSTNESLSPAGDAAAPSSPTVRPDLNAIDEVVGALQRSSLNSGVPQKISFGGRKGKSGFAKS